MFRWLSDASTPAWVQAIGSLVAILIAVLVPWFQRRNALRDVATDRARQQKDHLQRLVAGLREEIRAASDTADRRQSAITLTLEQVRQAANRGMTVKEPGPIAPGPLSLTEAVVYRQVAAEMGRLPPELIKSVVAFYAGALEINRVADGAPTAMQAYRNTLELLPRFKTYSAIVIRTLDKFEAADFSTTADIKPTPSEVRKFASDAGYPLDEIAKSRGIELPA